MSADDRPIIVLRLRPEPHVNETAAIHALRALLKSLLRDLGLRCISLDTTGNRHD